MLLFRCQTLNDDDMIVYRGTAAGGVGGAARRGVAECDDNTWRVGDVAQSIEKYAREQNIDLVISGSHGHGALASLAMGSVSTRLVATLSVPLLIITRGAAARADRKPGEGHGDAAAQREAVATP